MARTGRKPRPNPLVSLIAARAFLRETRPAKVTVIDQTVTEADFLLDAARKVLRLRTKANDQDAVLEILRFADVEPDESMPLAGINWHLAAVEHRLRLLSLHAIHATTDTLRAPDADPPGDVAARRALFEVVDRLGESIKTLETLRANINETRAGFVGEGYQPLVGKGLLILDAKLERAFAAGIARRCTKFGVALPDGMQLAALALLCDLETPVPAGNDASDLTTLRSDKWAKALARVDPSEFTDKVG